MNFDQRQKEPDLICTCNNLYRVDLQASIDQACEDSEEVMFDHGTQFRCEVCEPIITRMIEKSRKKRS